MTGKTLKLEIDSIAPGLNNRRPDFKLATDAGAFVRAAANADITAEGTAKRRGGYERIIIGNDCHSLWTDGDDALFVDGVALQRITGLPGAGAITVTLRSDLTPGRSMSFARLPDAAIAYSNGAVIGLITAAGLSPIAPPMPAIDPTVAASAGGALDAGVYSVCFTHVDAAGREGGSTVPVQVDVPANGRILLSNLLAAFPSGATGLVVYVSTANDATPLRSITVLAPTASLAIPVVSGSGRRCPTLLLREMPAGDIVRWSLGRLLVAIDSTLYFSEPFAPGLTNPLRGFLRFAEPITMLEPCGNAGVWLGTTKGTYWLAGDIAAATPDLVLTYGAVARTGAPTLNEKTVSWMSEQGLVIGDSAGQAVNLQQANVAVERAQAGAVLHRERDGMKQAIASLLGVEATQVAATSWMSAEIIRKGTSL